MLNAFDPHLMHLHQQLPPPPARDRLPSPQFSDEPARQEMPPVPVPRPRTPAQAEAARRNGSLSKGPRTPSGKEIAKMNGVRHGIFSRIARPGDDGRDYARLYDQGVRELEREFPLRTLETETLIARGAHLRVQLARIMSVYNLAGLGILRHPDAAETMAPILHDIDLADSIDECRFRSGDSLGRPPSADVHRVYTAMALDARRTLADELRRARSTWLKNADSRDRGSGPALPRRGASRGTVVDAYRALARHIRPLRPILLETKTVRDVLACRVPVGPTHRHAWEKLQTFVVAMLRRHAREVDRRSPTVLQEDAATVALYFGSLQNMSLLQLYETRTANALRSTLDRLRELNGLVIGEPTLRRCKRTKRRAKYVESVCEPPATTLMPAQPDPPVEGAA